MEGLSNLSLTKEEEEEICIKSRCKSDLLEECSLSLFGRLLADRNQNLRALKNTLRMAWKMGSDLQIVEVGNGIMQFKFSSEYQMKWVEQNGPWNFENNLLLLCRWKRGLSATNISFTHSPFWVQVWGLPFELMSDEVGRELGNNIGRFIEVDRRARQSDQAKFMRIRVDLQLEKPLRRGGKIASMEGEKFWVNFKYERLPIFCFQCGRLGHDEKRCKELSNQQNPRQYGEWLRAQGNSKMGTEKSRSTSNGDRGEGSADQFEGNHATATKISSTSVSDCGDGLSGSIKNQRASSSKNFEQAGGHSEGDGAQEAACAQSNQKVQFTVATSDACDRKTSSFSKLPCEVLKYGSTCELENHPPPDLARETKRNLGNELARDLSQRPLTDSTCCGMALVDSEDAYSLVGQKAHSEKQEMEVSSPIKPTSDQREKKEAGLENTGQGLEEKKKITGQWKRMAREKGKNKSPGKEFQFLNSGTKRAGKLISEEDEKLVVPQKKQRLVNAGDLTQTDERSAVTARQHRREP